jgi:hypothetical protein
VTFRYILTARYTGTWEANDKTIGAVVRTEGLLIIDAIYFYLTSYPAPFAHVPASELSQSFARLPKRVKVQSH